MNKSHAIQWWHNIDGRMLPQLCLKYFKHRKWEYLDDEDIMHIWDKEIPDKKYSFIREIMVDEAKTDIFFKYLSCNLNISDTNIKMIESYTNYVCIYISSYTIRVYFDGSISWFSDTVVKDLDNIITSSIRRCKLDSLVR